MKICFIADARSPIARKWIEYFPARGHQVDVISTHPCDAGAIQGASMYIFAARTTRIAEEFRGRDWMTRLRTSPLTRIALREFVQPVNCLRAAGAVKRLVHDIEPDILHALRIPTEGYLGAMAGHPHYVVSCWGNDFTLVSDRSLCHRWLTRRTLRAAAGFMADCQVDVDRAKTRGLLSGTMTATLPGAGGIKKTELRKRSSAADIRDRFGIPQDRPVIFNPRGFRPYVQNETFFKAIAPVVEHCPEVLFVASGMKGWPRAEKYAVRFARTQSLLLLGDDLSAEEMNALFRISLASVSPALHDGTPNTLLEAMAQGALPICGDLPSIREWITPGQNGLLFSPHDPKELAEAIVSAIRNQQFRTQAASLNHQLIAERADYDTCMSKAEQFYTALLQDHNITADQEPAFASRVRMTGAL